MQSEEGVAQVEGKGDEDIIFQEKEQEEGCK